MWNLAEWADAGTIAGGAATVLLAGAAILGGSAGLQDWRAKQREEASLAKEQAESIRLERDRLLHGWSTNGLPVYGVELVAEPAEIDRAALELTSGGPSDFVILRVNESANGNANRAYNLRQMIQKEHFLTRPPTDAEYGAIERGRVR